MKTKSTRRRWIYISVGVVLAVILVALILREPSIPVEVAAITRGPMQVTVESPGRTRVVDRYTITAPVTGYVERIELREGARLEEGQPITKIRSGALDPRSSAEARTSASAASSSAAAASAQVAEAEAELRLARAEAQRAETLAEEGVISEQSLDAARTRLDVAQRSVAAARERAAAARSDAARAQIATGAGPGAATATITAPSSGVVLRIPDRSARPVTAGEVLMEVGDARGIEVVADFLSEDAVRIRPGNPALLRDWGGPEALRGSVRLVEPSGFTKVSALGIEEQRVNVIVDIDDPPAQLGDGYRVDAAVVIWSTNDALRVPIAALGRVGERWNVLVVENGVARSRIISLGQRNDEYAEVLDGLEEGDTVILHPSTEIGDGTSVSPIL